MISPLRRGRRRRLPSLRIRDEPSSSSSIVRHFLVLFAFFLTAATIFGGGDSDSDSDSIGIGTCHAFVGRYGPTRSRMRPTVSVPSQSANQLQSSSSSSTAETAAAAAAPSTPPRTGKFQSGTYDAPIVLLGISGPGSELTRLASHLVATLSKTSSGDAGGGVTGAVLPTLGSSATSGSGQGGAVTLTPSLIREQIESGILTRSSVIVVDFGHPAFNPLSRFSSSEATKLTQRMIELAQSLYEDMGLLSIYVNVHPEFGALSEEAVKRREELEESVLIKYSDYEICVKDEGLDAMTVLAGMNGGCDDVDGEEGDVAVASTDVATDGEGVDDDDDDQTCTTETTLRTIQSEDQFAQLADLTSRQSTAWSGVEWELTRLVARAILPPPQPGAPSSVKQAVVGQNAELTLGYNTFFLSIVFPDMWDVEPYVQAMCLDVDAMEFRADLLGKREDRFEVLHSLQILRRLCQPHVVRAPALPLVGLEVIDDAMPIVFTVRTAHQAGTWPDDTEEDIGAMFKVLELGLRGGVEVLDVESSWDPVKTDKLLTMAEERYTSNILGSYHEVPDAVSTERAVELYHQCTLNGRAHGAKMVLSVDAESDDETKDRQAYEAGKIFKKNLIDEGKPVIPYLSMMLGEIGQFSRVINERFAPVTHESLPFVAAPGQLSASEIMTLKLVMGLLKPRKYCIIGHNIAYSVSPQMHSAAFAATRLPHSYSLVDIPDIEEFVASDLWNDEDFGGCSVTIPHKRTIMKHLDELSEAAEKIGAINTVIAKHIEDEETGETRRVMYGENTDWRGFYTALRRRLGADPPSSDVEEETERAKVVLIVGAGGAARAAAYAVAELGDGYEQVYYNPRTPAKAKDLAESFGGRVVTDLEDGLKGVLEEMGAEVRVVICTLPASAEFVLPNWMVKDAASEEEDSAEVGALSPPVNRPIVYDVSYIPYWTKLISQAEEAGLDVVRGSEMLWEQGVGQFELWTGRMAPYRVMKQLVLKITLPNYTSQLPQQSKKKKKTPSKKGFGP